MDRAIIFGATSYVARKVVSSLLVEGISILAIGRRSLADAKKVLVQDSNLIQYLQLDINSASELLKDKKWKDWASAGETVMYNFVWSGIKRLTDGDFRDQLKNVAEAVNLIKIAKELGCIKYINSGSQEECLLESKLNQSWQREAYFANSVYYAGAKLINRDMLTLMAYLEGIDFVNTRFSVVVDSGLSGEGFVAKSLRKVIRGESLEPILNNQLYEIVDLDELAMAYVAIGYKGKNKSDYYIGLGKPAKLSQFFHKFFLLKNGDAVDEFEGHKDGIKCFENSLLFQDTGFKLTKSFKDIAQEALK